MLTEDEQKLIVRKVKILVGQVHTYRERVRKQEMSKHCFQAAYDRALDRFRDTLKEIASGKGKE